jgi:hypothetical protein
MEFHFEIFFYSISNFNHQKYDLVTFRNKFKFKYERFGACIIKQFTVIIDFVL